tara:strand:- start:1009 stop:1467 length:459 start_codon:yes stop_codon:yes gene_type:complete
MCVSTGNRFLDIGLATAAAVATSGASLSASATTITGAAVKGSTLATKIGVGLGAQSVGYASAIGGAVLGTASSFASEALLPKTPEYNAQSYDYSPIAYNSQQNTVTGSGGAQAPALLASEIKRIKDVRKRQEGVRSPSLNIESFDQTGLQLA